MKMKLTDMDRVIQSFDYAIRGMQLDSKKRMPKWEREWYADRIADFIKTKELFAESFEKMKNEVIWRHSNDEQDFLL